MTNRDEERFWSQVDISGGPDACWIWFGTVRFIPNRTPWFKTGRIHKPAARWAIYFTSGRWPAARNARVYRTCGESMCVNPRHSRTVTYYTGTGVCPLGGHPMTPEMTTYMNNGYVECATCRNRRRAEKRQADQEREATSERAGEAPLGP